MMKKSIEISWKFDETCIKIKEEWCCLYLAIDKEGNSLDIQLRKKRSHQAAHVFMKRYV